MCLIECVCLHACKLIKNDYVTLPLLYMTYSKQYLHNYAQTKGCPAQVTKLKCRQAHVCAYYLDTKSNWRNVSALITNPDQNKLCNPYSNTEI